MDPREAKTQLRQSIKDRLARLSPTERAAESRSLCRRILESLPPNVTVCAFVPMSDEADIRPMLAALMKTHALFLPAMENGKLGFRQATDLASLTPGPFGIPEPPTDAPLLESTGPVIVLVPGRAFDRKGNRMGRGNGGYDVWIRKRRKDHPETKFWGVALEAQLVQEIPMEPHDEKLDAVITARGMSLLTER